MKRLCFFLPNIDSADAVVSDLRQNGIGDTRIHVLANENIAMGDLPEAGIVYKSDFYPELGRGLALGGSIGVIGGLVSMRVAGAVFGGAAILWFGLISAGIDALPDAVAGTGFPSSRLTEFESAIDAGRILVLVDTERVEAPMIERLVTDRHPDVEVEAIEPRASRVLHRP
jgi:hypothetical protein